jgi:ribonuclease P protein component
MSHEENIPAEQPAPQEETRISGADALEERTQGTERAEEKGAEKGFRLTYPREVRLRHRTEFQNVYRRGSRVSGRFVVLFFLANGLTYSRMGVTASRKVGTAVVRARCRRRARELFRRHRHRLGDVGLDVVINAKRNWKQTPWVELEEDFLRCLRRLEG